MNNLQRHQLIALLHNFYNAGLSLSEFWTNLQGNDLQDDEEAALSHTFPFAESFDEVVHKIAHWKETAGEAIFKLPQTSPDASDTSITPRPELKAYALRDFDTIIAILQGLTPSENVMVISEVKDVQDFLLTNKLVGLDDLDELHPDLIEIYQPNAKPIQQPELEDFEGCKVRIIADKRNEGSNLIIANFDDRYKLNHVLNRIAAFTAPSELLLPEEQLRTLLAQKGFVLQDDGTDPDAAHKEPNLVEIGTIAALIASELDLNLDEYKSVHGRADTMARVGEIAVDFESRYRHVVEWSNYLQYHGHRQSDWEEFVLQTASQELIRRKKEEIEIYK